MNPENLQSLLSGPKTDPLQLYRSRDALYATDLLAAALVWLDLFTVLDRNPSDLPTLCGTLEIQPRPTDVLLTLLQAMGLIERRGSVFHITPTAREHLVPGSPWYLGPYYASMKDRPVTLDYVKVLRTGKPSNWASLKDQKAWAQAMEEDGFAKQFTAAMDCRGLYLGSALSRVVDLSGRKLILDVAGGSGIYACCLTSAFAGLRGLVFEKPPVDRIARQAIADRGCTGRVDVVAGDMFREEWPTHADTHLISNVLHDWDIDQVKDILQRSYRALPQGGWLLVHDMHINADKTGPLAAAQYSALLMSITEGKCYSETEMAEMLRDIGFTAPIFKPTAADRSVMICAKA